MGTLSVGTVLSQPCCGFFQGHALTKRLVTAPYCKSGNGILTSANSSVFPSNFLYVNSKYSSLKNPCYRNGTRLVVKAKAKADYYSVLGVDKDASKSEIKTAYRRLARNFHPDVNKEPSAEQKFKEIGNAYEVLSDEEKRSIYDRYGEDGLNGSAGMGGYGNPFDMFESFFGGGFSSMNMGGQGFTNGNEGDDLLYNLKLNFKEAVFGVEKEIEINRLDKCTTCEGSGAKPGTRGHVCRSCRGQGQVISSARTPLGIFQQVTTCPTCEGTGETLTPCKKCKGDGRVRKYKKVKVNIPPGVDTGNQLRVKLEGDAGWRGGANGDLFVALEVRPDPVLRREGNNILYTGKISYTDAILGTIMNVPSLDGMVELRVSPGTQPGAVLVMDKKGVPFLNKRNRRGDQLVKVQVEIPKRIGEEERKIIEDLASLNKAKVGSTQKVQA